jgi:hypothetical protein
MRLSLDRRSFLHHSVVLGGSLLTCSSVLDRASRADLARIEAPVIDQLTVREITDGTHDIFLRPADLPGLTVRRTGFPATVISLRAWGGSRCRKRAWH